MWSHAASVPFLSRCRCYLLDGISKGAWLNRSSIIFAGNDKWSVDPRVSIVSSVGDKHEYSLQITKVDVTDDGLYTCSIQSERSPRPKLLNLIVKGECLSHYADRDMTTVQNATPQCQMCCFCRGKDAHCYKSMSTSLTKPSIDFHIDHAHFRFLTNRAIVLTPEKKRVATRQQKTSLLWNVCVTGSGINISHKSCFINRSWRVLLQRDGCTSAGLRIKAVTL